MVAQAKSPPKPVQRVKSKKGSPFRLRDEDRDRADAIQDQLLEEGRDFALTDIVGMGLECWPHVSPEVRDRIQRERLRRVREANAA